MSELAELFEREMAAATAAQERDDELMAAAARGEPFWCAGKESGEVVGLQHLANMAAECGAHANTLYLNPERYAEAMVYFARLEKRARRRIRMARKKRRGWT